MSALWPPSDRICYICWVRQRMLTVCPGVPRLQLQQQESEMLAMELRGIVDEVRP